MSRHGPLAAVLLAALLAPAARAAADTLGELPFHPVAGAATCLRATGAPGGLVRWVRGGAELLDADAAGVRAAGRVKVGRPAAGCPVAATQPDGAAVVAEPVTRDGAVAVRVAVRDPGGSFAAPVTVASGLTLVDLRVRVAVDPTGDDLVAVGAGSQVLAVRRRAGGHFGPVQWLSRTHDLTQPALDAGLDVAGDATVAWGDVAAGAVSIASAPAGRRLRLEPRIVGAEEPALAVAPSGGTLLAMTTGLDVLVAERSRRDAKFGAPRVLHTSQRDSFTASAAVLRDDGAAIVAWRDGVDASGVMVATRPAGGDFGRVRRLATPGFPNPFIQALTAVSPGEPPFDSEGGQVRAAPGGDRFVLA